ncbi:MAG TPA: flagellar export chaperone FlgN [Spirochaetia bacterium]|nr:flagellar export chaperone FlgN [Spirochaetales bacterium]HRS64792.1 flagellar export chaperone FlgN [Spirochaetia bacterium]HOT58961.1 flagellar export chaperone FlgN [Spirochaetales bacterium]HPD79458.1 flagellar export chaperone FlgN [Spirochaetales bacterium]HQG39930.1 flagellar export chaperone FlgN [Spirochaetales bacterium]
MNTDLIHYFISCVVKESSALAEFITAQSDMRTAIFDRDWLLLQEAYEKATRSAETVNMCEKNRCQAWEKLCNAFGLPGTATRQELLACIPEPYNSMIRDAVLNIKVMATRAKIENDALRAFAQSSSESIGAIMQELFPEQKGKLYGRKGTLRHAESMPIVIDTSL